MGGSAYRGMGGVWGAPSGVWHIVAWVGVLARSHGLVFSSAAGGAHWQIAMGGGFGMTPWCDDLVCSWRRLLADRHSLPFPWTLSLHRRWCPSASHHPLTFLFLLALTFPLPSPFPSLGLSLCRPPCPSASPHSFPSLSLGRLCQRSPRTYPVSLLCVESTQRKANAFAFGQVRPSGHPKPAVRYLSPTAAGGPWDGHLRGRFPDGGT